MVSHDLFPFRLKIEISTRGTNSMPFLVFQWDHLRSTSGIIFGPIWGSFLVGGSFAVLYRPTQSSAVAMATSKVMDTQLTHQNLCGG